MRAWQERAEQQGLSFAEFVRRALHYQLCLPLRGLRRGAAYERPPSPLVTEAAPLRVRDGERPRYAPVARPR